MASTNQSPEYLAAEKHFHFAQTDSEKLEALEEMMRTAPKHKAGEAMRANISTRYKKLKAEMERKKKVKKSSSKEGIKKEGIQVILIGLTNSGKSSLISQLTNAKPEISSYLYTTRYPTIGALEYEGIKFQIIDMPAINSEYFDAGIAHTADILLILIEKIEDIEEVEKFLEKANGKKIIVFNKTDLLTGEDKRKISAYLQSKKYNFVMISCKSGENLNELKNKLVQNSGIIRVYTKQPHQQADKDPVQMPPNSTVGEIAKKIFHSKIIIKEIRVTGPSSKFPNQKVGLSHILKDKDIVEFKTD